MKVLHHRDRIARAGGSVVFVAHDTPQRVGAGLLRGIDLPWPMLVDLDRVTYRAWGCGGPRSAPSGWTQGLGALWMPAARRAAAATPGRDTLHLGGDFVVDPNGVVAWARPQHGDDRPPVGMLLVELERAARR